MNVEDNQELQMQGGSDSDRIISLSGMYKEYFLDYASYVILERAVPAVEDGLKPVQRRILHSMKVMDDGRYHKVANIIGQTMQYHPHGDAAIGAALVNLGQKDLLIDCQGNWGDIRTGDSSAAPRYIEARLTKFALEVAFNNQTTQWQVSYDGRKKEPITLPMKFPLLLAQGVEGIAVGLSTKIMPHNFIDLIKGSIRILQDKKVKIYPDFQTGGLIDVSDYNNGKRGGKIKMRAKIVQKDKNSIAITELPYGITTGSLIDSIVKANDKGQIKIKKVVDNTAKNVEILIELASGVSPSITMDALYAFTNCEISISPNACVIVDHKPLFLTVSELLEISTWKTKDLLRQELEIKKSELEEKWHFSSLEKIFIENRIYRDIEECETWEAVINAIDTGLKKYVATPSYPDSSGNKLKLVRDVTQEDIVRLTEIKIKRISKYNSFKADELIKQIEEDLRQVNYDLAHLTDFTIRYFENLLDKYGKGKERKTEISSFDTIKASRVVANNAKLYVNRKEGFIGSGLKKDEFVTDCSDIDDIIAFMKSGKFVVSRIADKVFVGKNILHTGVWKKGDKRTTYNMIYLDGKTGRTMAKRFNIKSITRDRQYDLTKGSPGSKILYFTVNPNGESETVSVQLSPNCSAKKKILEFDFADLAIKGRGSQGNIVTKYPVKKITQTSVGKSSLGAVRIWMDEVSGRLNTEERGKSLGAFDTGSLILALYNDGSYELRNPDLNHKFEVKSLMWIGKYQKELPISAVYFEGEKGWSMVKRFEIETSTLDQKFGYIGENKSSRLYFATHDVDPLVKFSFKIKNQKQEQELKLAEFIDVKGWKSIGNKLGEFKILKIDHINPEVKKEKTENETPEVYSKQPPDTPSDKDEIQSKEGKGNKPPDDKKYSAGDTIEFDF